MKVVKMKIHRGNRGSGHTKYVYPPGFDSSKIVMGPWYDPEAKNRGEDWETIIFGVRDKDLDKFLDMDGLTTGVDLNNGFRFSSEEITREQAELEVTSRLRDEEFELGSEYIQDHVKVAKVLAKIAKGKRLSSEDKRVIDPDDPADGVRRKRSVKDHWDEKFSVF